METSNNSNGSDQKPIQQEAKSDSNNVPAEQKTDTSQKPMFGEETKTGLKATDRFYFHLGKK